jgi:hypothetical protein
LKRNAKKVLTNENKQEQKAGESQEKSHTSHLRPKWADPYNKCKAISLNIKAMGDTKKISGWLEEKLMIRC